MSKEATKKFIENYGFICNNCGKIIVDGDKHRNEEGLCDQCKIADLEAKLAEKEAENTKLKEVVDCVDKLKQFNADIKDYALVNRDVADEIYCEHQDKISFALEQLEKVKEFADGVKLTMIYVTNESTKTIQTLLDKIDNQIDILRTDKDGKH